MEVIAVISLVDFEGMIEDIGLGSAIDMAYQMRELLQLNTDGIVLGECMETVIVSFDTMQEALDDIRHIFGAMRGIPTAAALGYGQVSLDAEGDPWGIEVVRARKLAATAQPSEILMTPFARDLYNAITIEP